MQKSFCKKIKKSATELLELRTSFVALAESGWTGANVRSGKNIEQKIRGKMEELGCMMIVEYLGHHIHFFEKQALRRFIYHNKNRLNFSFQNPPRETAEHLFCESERLVCRDGAVVGLRLGNMALAELDDEIGDLKNLKKLYLHENQLKGDEKMFKILRSLPNLVFLDISFNFINEEDPRIVKEYAYWKQRLGKNFVY